MEKEMESKDEASTPNATEEGPDVAGGLPELSMFERHWAENPNQKSWAFKNMSAGVGHVWHMDDMGLVLRVASEDTMRLRPSSTTTTAGRWSRSSRRPSRAWTSTSTRARR